MLPWKQSKSFLVVMDRQRRGGERGRTRFFWLHLIFLVPSYFSCNFLFFWLGALFQYFETLVFLSLQMPLPPGVYERLTSSPTLMNLAQALAYHKAYEQFSYLLMIHGEVFFFFFLGGYGFSQLIPLHFQLL